MSANLREAAARMRERAQAATEGPWRTYRTGTSAGVEAHSTHGWRRTVVATRQFWARPGEPAHPDMVYICTWPPEVALAVADWLDFESEVCVNDDGQNEPVRTAALAVATAYLGGAE